MQAAPAILLVDQDGTFAHRTAQALTAAADEFTVETVSSVEAALAALDDDSYDCVVSEHELPDGDGLELLETVRVRHDALPFILYTDQGSEALAGDAIAAGVSGYLRKADDSAPELARRIRHAIEADLGESPSTVPESRLRTLFERTSDGLFTVDEDWRYTSANEAGADMVGVEADELVGERVWDVFETLEHTPFADALRTAMDERKPADEEAYFAPLDRYFDVSVYPDTAGISIFFRDVTERYRRLQMVRRLHETAGELFKEPDPARAAQLCVDAIADVLGYPLNGVWLQDGGVLEPVAVTGTDLIDAGVATFAEGSLAWERFTSGESRVFEDVSTEDDVHNPQTEIRSEMIVPVGRFGVIIVSSRDQNAFAEEDLTIVELVAYHLEASLERSEHERRLEHERNRFEAAFDTVPEPAVHVILDDTDPIIHRINKAFEETFGVDAETAVGRSIDELIVPPDAADDAIEINEAVRESGRYEAEIVRMTTDGERPFLFTAKRMPVADVDDAPVEAVATYVDLSEQLERERELTRQNERLERFTEVLSHDIPNHLSVAAGNLELARETDDLSFLDQVETAHDRIETLLSDMETLVETGSPIDSIEPLQLGAVAESCWTSCCSEDDPQSLDIVEDGRLLADRTRLTQLLENLMWNACDHGGEDITITITVTDDGFVVEDDGHGIPEDIRESVFETGYTTSAAGTGFGLAIVREIAGAHGWDIDLEESESGGARFVFTGVDRPDS